MSDLYGDGPISALGNGFPEPAFKDGSPIGLVDNGDVRIHCTTCEYIRDGICIHSDPRIHGRPVTAAMCCNLYDHAGMKVIV